jgi:hypothetical protein
MITWKQLVTDKTQRKKLILFVVVSNLLFVVVASYFFFREEFFDTSRRPVVNAKAINKVEVREGSWKWKDMEWSFGHDTKLIISNTNDIANFCDTFQSAPAKYIDNIRPVNWLYIYFTSNGKEELSIILQDNYQGEIFIEYDDHTYDGSGIAELIRALALKNAN